MWQTFFLEKKMGKRLGSGEVLQQALSAVTSEVMNQAFIVLPNQLFEQLPATEGPCKIFIIEEHLFFRQFEFHKAKIAFHRASMRSYADHLGSQGLSVDYIESTDKKSDIRQFLKEFKKKFDHFHFYEADDDWIDRRIRKTIPDNQLTSHTNPSFLCTTSDLDEYWESHKKILHHDFYLFQRRRLNVLMQGQEPLGGKWSFDEDNRKKYPRTKQAPEFKLPEANKYHQEASDYVNSHFLINPGELDHTWNYPINHNQAKDWLENFFISRLDGFGTYEDAIQSEEYLLHHSLLSPLLNSGLLLPDYTVNRILDFATENGTELNDLEGLIRQIIGWREFIRAVYLKFGRKQRTKNFWKFKRKIPGSFYDGTTGILPIDQTIKKVLKSSYAHHIERLMILGNFMLLCEFDPDEVYRWFMELFIDAYDWVMVPNIYGMSQFADGGIFATKPYISGSNYVRKMSNYPKGDWQDTWDALFWSFLHRHRDFFQKNFRMRMLLNTWDKMPAEKRNKHLDLADNYFKSLEV